MPRQHLLRQSYACHLRAVEAISISFQPLGLPELATTRQALATGRPKAE